MENDDPQELRVRDANGQVVLRIGLSMTLYFRPAYSQQVREQVAQCFDDYRALCGPYLKWAHPGPRGFQKLDSPVDSSPSQWLRDPTREEHFEEQGWEFYWHGGNTQEEASDFRLSAFGAANRRGNELSFLTAALPLSWYAHHEGSFPSLLLSWCQRLKPEHGYGGITVLESPRLSVSQTHGAIAYSMARRFPGLDLDDPSTHAGYLKEGIKGGNWLTVLSTKYVDKLGGLATLTRGLGEGFLLQEYPGGVLIQTGPAPELGDVNRQLIPERYRHLAQVLRPIRVKVHSGFHGLGLTREQSDAWLARFDGV